MSLTKEHIINSIYNHLDFPKRISIDLVESLLEIIKKTLENGEDVLISGFGKFCVKEKHERRGRNPATGVGMMLGSRRVVTFKCSAVLKSRLMGRDETCGILSF